MDAYVWLIEFYELLSNLWFGLSLAPRLLAIIKFAVLVLGIRVSIH